jgi:hypothetical protein
MTRKILPVLTLAILIALTIRVDAFRLGYTEQGKVLKWENTEAVFYVVTNGLHPGFHQPILNAMGTWNNAPSNFHFRNGGTRSQGIIGNDRVNHIGFGELPMEYAGMNYFYYRTDTGIIVDSDIVLNLRYPWSTTGDRNALDVETIALHEFGHTLYLADLYSEDKVNQVMFGLSAPGIVKRSLHQEDIDGIVTLHGSSSGSGGGGGCTIVR